MSDTKYIGKICDAHPEALGDRYLCNRRCVQCAAGAVAMWRANNRTKVRKASLKYQKKNREKINAAARRRREQARRLKEFSAVDGHKLEDGAKS